MEIRERLTADMKSAMRERDQLRLEAIRFLQAAIKYREIELRPNPINEDEVTGVIKRMVKQRKESIEQYLAANRQDLVDKETRELAIIEAYLPAALDESAIAQIVEETVAELGATSPKEMGQVMKATMAKLAGQNIDGKVVSSLVKAKLGA